MPTNFPTSLDSTTNLPTTIADATSQATNHPAYHNTEDGALIAIETKVGIGASTPTNGLVLTGGATPGTSMWTAVGSGGITIASGGLTVNSGNTTLANVVVFSSGAGRIVGQAAGTIDFYNSTLASANLTIADGGGVTVPRGGLTVTAGNVGIGAGGIGGATALKISSNDLTGSVQSGVLGGVVGSSAATSGVDGFRSIPETAAAAFTSAAVTSFHALTAVKGAGSTITSAVGLLVDAITSGNNNNYGVDIGSPSGGSGDNLSLRATGAIRFSGLGARVAGDVYVIVDSSGNLHKSAIGPAS